MNASRYVIGFGYERDRAGFLTGMSQEHAAQTVERIAVELMIPAYALRFGPGSWMNERGFRIHEQGGTVEFIADEHSYAAATARTFAERIREYFRQDCVVYYVQPVTEFNFI